MTKKTIELVVNARPVGSKLDDEDLHVPGTYLLEVDQDLPAAQRADAALDIFHSRVPVGVLEDFEFDVIDSVTKRVLDPCGGDGGTAKLASRGYIVTKTGEQPLLVAECEVQGVGDEGDPALCGLVIVAGADQGELRKNAIEAIFDERLRTAGLSPAARVHEMRACSRVERSPRVAWVAR